jgi:hypothetical protein
MVTNVAGTSAASAADEFSFNNTACAVAVTVSPMVTTEFSLGLSAGGCPAVRFDVQQYDLTMKQGWFGLTTVSASVTARSGTEVVEGYAGHSYQFRARVETSTGAAGPWTTVSATVAGSTPTAYPFAGLYTMDGYGGVNADASPPLGTSASWPGWNIARAARMEPMGSGQTGAVLDGYGGLHSFGYPIVFQTTAYWQGWDIARDFAWMPNGGGGFVLDGYGGLHAFHVSGNTAPLTAVGFTYWPGWDIARKVVIFPDGKGGYVMDAYGGLHPFGINGRAPMTYSQVQLSAYWGGWKIARDVVLEPGNGGHSGYVLDGYGGLHPFHATNDASVMPPAIAPPAYWPGWDIARSVWLLPQLAPPLTTYTPAGYTLDGYGGLHPFGGMPALTNTPRLGRDLAKNLLGD